MGWVPVSRLSLILGTGKPMTLGKSTCIGL